MSEAIEETANVKGTLQRLLDGYVDHASRGQWGHARRVLAALADSTYPILMTDADFEADVLDILDGEILELLDDSDVEIQSRDLRAFYRAITLALDRRSMGFHVHQTDPLADEEHRIIAELEAGIQ